MDQISSNRFKVIERAQAEGFGPQMQFLISQGFTIPSQNLKYLRRHNGDQNTALSDLKANSQGNGEGEIERSSERKKKSMEDDYEAIRRNESSPREEWDEMIKILYLDGNNLLFVDSTIRSLSLKKQLEKAEACIVGLAEEFAKSVGLKKLIVVFDDTRLLDMNFSFDRSLIEVRKARPSHRTADDFLVAELPKLSQLDSTGFVTSDRELITRLSRKGGKNLIKSGKWFACVKSKLGMSRYEEILKEISGKTLSTK